MSLGSTTMGTVTLAFDFHMVGMAQRIIDYIYKIQSIYILHECYAKLHTELFFLLHHMVIYQVFHDRNVVTNNNINHFQMF